MGKFAMLWVDDQYDDPSTPNRHPPSGFIGCRTALEAIRWIRAGARGKSPHGAVIAISLDHDLGDHVIGNGYTVAKYIERETLLGRTHRVEMKVHSANPVGRDRILAAIRSCENFWDLQDVHAR